MSNVLLLNSIFPIFYSDSWILAPKTPDIYPYDLLCLLGLAHFSSTSVVLQLDFVLYHMLSSLLYVCGSDDLC